MTWYIKSALLLWKVGIYALAVCGVGSVGSVLMIATGKISPEELAQFATMVQSFGAYIVSLSGGTIIGIVSRFALPAWAEYRRNNAALFMQEITSQIREQVLAGLNEKKS